MAQVACLLAYCLVLIDISSIKTRQYAKRQATWARTRMNTWDKISLNKIDAFVKKLDKSSLKLDQLT